MKNNISDIKNTLERIKSRLIEAEDQISDLKNKVGKTHPIREMKRKKKT